MSAVLKVQIEKGIPLPSYADRGAVYPWREMQVNDSFFATGKTIDQMSRMANRRQHSYGYVYRCRTMDGGVRVWRVA